MRWSDLLWALVAAVVVAVAWGWVKRRAERPYVRQIQILRDDAIHQLARQNGYTLRLLSEDGEEIGIQAHGSFHPDYYRAGQPFAYGHATYEVVSVQNDDPKASGTLVLRPASR
jgi:hypothetical protein